MSFVAKPLRQLRDAVRSEPPGRVSTALAVGFYGGIFPIPGLTTWASLAMCALCRMGASLTAASIALNLLVTPVHLALIVPWATVGAHVAGAPLPDPDVLVAMLTENTTAALTTFGAAVGAGCCVWAAAGVAAIPLVYALVRALLLCVSPKRRPHVDVSPQVLNFPPPLSRVISHKVTLRAAAGAALFKFRTREHSRRRYRVAADGSDDGPHFGVVAAGLPRVVEIKYLPKKEAETPEQIGDDEVFEVIVQAADAVTEALLAQGPPGRKVLADAGEVARHAEAASADEVSSPLNATLPQVSPAMLAAHAGRWGEVVKEIDGAAWLLFGGSEEAVCFPSACLVQPRVRSDAAACPPSKRDLLQKYRGQTAAVVSRSHSGVSLRMGDGYLLTLPSPCVDNVSMPGGAVGLRRAAAPDVVDHVREVLRDPDDAGTRVLLRCNFSGTSAAAAARRSARTGPFMSPRPSGS